VFILAFLALLLGAAGRDASASIVLKSFTATPQPDRSIRVNWETASEVNISAFRLYRTENVSQVGQPVTTVQAKGDPVTGAVYEYGDPASGLTPGKEYFYRLEALSTSGGSIWYGPVSARTVLFGVFLPIIHRGS
jgi:hypothetical protein